MDDKVCGVGFPLFKEVVKMVKKFAAIFIALISFAALADPIPTPAPQTTTTATQLINWDYTWDGGPAPKTLRECITNLVLQNAWMPNMNSYTLPGSGKAKFQLTFDISGYDSDLYLYKNGDESTKTLINNGDSVTVAGGTKIAFLFYVKGYDKWYNSDFNDANYNSQQYYDHFVFFQDSPTLPTTIAFGFEDLLFGFDSSGNFLNPQDGTVTDYDYNDEVWKVRIEPVEPPAPAALFLCLPGILGLGFLKFRRRKT